jgi:5'-nucleotidase
VAAPIANRPAGSITETLSRVPNDAGESVLGDIIADAQLAATSAEANGGAVIAFTNPGGVRADIPKKEDGAVTYADVFASQPFRNQLVTLTLTARRSRTCSSSNGSIRSGRGSCRSRKGSATHGTAQAGRRARHRRSHVAERPAIDPAMSYRVTVNNFLSVGGDGFTVLKEGTAPQFGIYDVDALYAYFQANSPIARHRRRSHRANELNGPPVRPFRAAAQT